jgi:UrcA family protein
MKTSNYLRCGALLAGALLLSTSAMARPLGESVVTRTATIQYRPGEAKTPAGAAALYQKLQMAAEKVCLDAANASETTGSYMVVTCISDALGKAVDELGIASVSVLHVQQTPGNRMAAVTRQ